MAITSGERPRSVGPIRAAAILYGDWGTSKAYVLGIAFALAGYQSFPILVAMGVLTALIAFNYYWVCVHHPDGGGVYSSVRERSRVVAIIGALLLIADYLVTASLSVLEGFNYIAHLIETQFHLALPAPNLWAIGLILGVGLVNWWGPRHSGSIAVCLAIPASLAALSILAVALPYLGQAHFDFTHLGLMENWSRFAGVVLALSGVEAIANLTGVMVPDARKDRSQPVTVRRTSKRAIVVVALEVCIVTVLLAWAMHATPGLDRGKPDAMLGQIAHYFANRSFGEHWAAVYVMVVNTIMALLLFSAGNTAIIDMVSIFFMMSKDREMPAEFGKLNRHGVPAIPLMVATALPCLLLLLVKNVQGMAALYAIGVVGAITINLGATATNRAIPLKMPVRVVMTVSALIMLGIWITVGVEKHEAVVFAVTILALGLVARSFVQERRQVKVDEELRDLVVTTADLGKEGGSRGEIPHVLVALRGVTETLRFALEETQFRKGRLSILFVREVNVLISVTPNVQEDDDALRILHAARAAAGSIPFQFIYRTSDKATETILDVVRDVAPDYLILGASAEGPIVKLLRGSVVNTIAQHLPKTTRLLIYSWHATK